MVELVHPMDGTRRIADGMAAFDAIIERLPACDAIFFGTDILGCGAVLRALDRGIAVPEEVAVAGFGGLDFTRHTRPALTTIRVASYEMGFAAGRKLLHRLNGEPVPHPIELHPVVLEMRGSTGG